MVATCLLCIVLMGLGADLMTIQASNLAKQAIWGREVGEALKSQVLPLGERGEDLGKPLPLVVSGSPFPRYSPGISQHCPDTSPDFD